MSRENQYCSDAFSDGSHTYLSDVRDKISIRPSHLRQTVSFVLLEASVQCSGELALLKKVVEMWLLP